MGPCSIERNLSLVMLIYCLNISDSKPKMECFCELVPHLSEGLCLTVNFLVNKVAIFGMVVLIAISISHLWLNQERIISKYQYINNSSCKWRSLLIKCCIVQLFKKKKKNVWCSQMCNTKCRANFYFILVHVKLKK